MIANRIALLFITPALLFLYLAWVVDPAYAPWMVPFILFAVVTYIMAPQINWQWYQRWPPDLNESLTSLLERFSGFYRNLVPLEKQRFRTRIAMFRMNTDWTPMGFPEDELPPDIELALASQAVMLTFMKEEYLFRQFEKVIVYPLPFPSPEFPFAHASEMYEADGCLLFSAQQVLQGFIQPKQFYNIGLHEYARVFIAIYPNEPYPDFSAEDIWGKLEYISKMDRASIESIIGLAGIPVLPVAIHHYFIFPEQFKLTFPEETKGFDKIFNRTTLLPDTLVY
ncbi:MAG: zinc-dependent peptidase [Bacteroidota bacterium]